MGFTVLFFLAAAPHILASEVPPIGAGARIQAAELGPGWHYGFVNRIRSEPPCHLVLLFKPRTTSQEPLRVRATIPISRITRLQLTSHPGSSMQQWDGLSKQPVPEDSWREVDVAPLLPEKGTCNFDKLPK